MSKSKDKGSQFESQVVAYMRRVLGGCIERRVQAGRNDRGDVSGVFLHGRRCVIECKNHARMELAAWLDEAEAERGNDDAGYAVVVHKRRGCGEKGMGGTYVTMDLRTFCAIVANGPEYLEEDGWDC